ncbi:hypothetical protein Lal_00020275 [Lupinus albus]|nr:hypothetical protein Lal_00020275 [Lupinus albus]
MPPSFPFEPEVVDVLSARFNAPRGEGIGGETWFEPIGEGLRRREGVAAGRVEEDEAVEVEASIVRV